MQQNKTYHLSDVEDFPALCVKGHQSGGDEVSPPRFHPAIQHLIEIHLDKQNNKLLTNRPITTFIPKFALNSSWGLIKFFVFLSADVCTL